MITEDFTPRWMNELTRLSAMKSQLFLYGNIKDTVLYPVGKEQETWTIGPLRAALFELSRHLWGGYDLIAAYNQVDGMVFADAHDDNTMHGLFEDLYTAGEQVLAARNDNKAPQPAKPRNAFDNAIQQMRVCLMNRQYPCIFIIEHASQILTSPDSLTADERLSFLRLLKATSESQIVASTEGEEMRATQNLIIMLCDKLPDLPPWFYLNNPFTGSIELAQPGTLERKHFFDLFLPSMSVTKQQQEKEQHEQEEEEQEKQREEPTSNFDVDDLVDLTEGMTIRELCGIRTLARHAEQTGSTAKKLVDAFKYGGKISEWDHLDWERLATAEEKLSERVIGQQPAITAVADVLRRARLNLSGAQHSSRTKPRGVLFFAGPTGVGKTELAKSIAELIFTTEDACARFDMSEYSQAHADQRLLGAPPGYVGYDEGGQLTNRIKSDPFCVLLFDEIEKAHTSVLDKFLQILEDGRMTDGHGETVYFSESIIIFTSNIGIYKIDPATDRPMVDPFSGKPLLHVDPAVDIEYDQVQRKVQEGVQEYFKHVLGRPELLNRIGQNIIVFDFIRPPVMRQILEHKVLKSIQTQVADHWKMDVQFAPAVIEQLVAIGGTDIAAGGRGIGNLAEMAILNPLARTMFIMLSHQESLEGRTMVITSVIPPQTANAHRYEITWEFVA